MSTFKNGFMHRSGDIDWYCEQRGQGPDIVLIPSGEGDCSAFEKVAALLAPTFRVTTFDTPGYSRTSDPADPADISGATLGAQIAGLLHALGIKSATIYGCSSGGVAALDLIVQHRDLARNVIVHEIAEIEDVPPMLVALTKLDDPGIAAALTHVFATALNENTELWNALGPDYHARMTKNYVTWIRRYIQGKMHEPLDPAALSGLPITWSIGGLSMVAHVFGSILTSHRAGIELKMLPCRHFPQVSIPDMLAAHIRACAMQGES